MSFMALITRAEGTAHITETIFENRFMHVQELNRLRASRKLDGREGNASHGTENLQGGPHHGDGFARFLFLLYLCYLYYHCQRK